MEIIPYSIHLPALIGLVIFAVYRPSLFPLVLTVTYTAIFQASHFIESYEFVEQIIISSTLASMILSFTITFGKDVRYASRFSLCLLLGILNIIVMYSARNLVDGYNTAAQVATSGLTYTLHIAEYYFLLRMIHGARGRRIDKVIIDWCLSGLSVFKPSNSAIPFHNSKTESER